MPKLFIIETHEVEYHVTAMDTEDAVRTAQVDPEGILAIKEYDNHGDEVLH